MKRLICLLMTVMLLFCFSSCANDRVIKNPVNLYYLSSDTSESGMLIQPEVREASADLEEQLNEYLRGPLDEAYVSPFPQNVHIVAIKQSDSISEIVLSDSFASLSGYELTVACACLTKTLQELVDTKLVNIRAENATLDGNAYITMNTDALITIDENN